VTKWQQEARVQASEKGDAEYDFFNDPARLMVAIKEDAKSYVEEEYTLQSFFAKAKNILAQFRGYYNPFNGLLADQPSFILKTRRIQYTFEKYRERQLDAGTLHDFAEVQLVNEVKYWATKYILLSWVGGLNVAFVGYHVLFKNLKRFIGLPLTFVVFFEARNLIMKNCMDKIYYPIEPLYQRLRSTEKKEQPKAKEVSKVDLLKQELDQEYQRDQRLLQTVKQEMVEEEQQSVDRMEHFLFEKHGRFVNEGDFVNGKEGYKQFVDLYIHLLYEPLHEEYEETCYFTKEWEKNLFRKLKWHRKKKLVNLELKS